MFTVSIPQELRPVGFQETRWRMLEDPRVEIHVDSQIDDRSAHMRLSYTEKSKADM